LFHQPQILGIDTINRIVADALGLAQITGAGGPDEPILFGGSFAVGAFTGRELLAVVRATIARRGLGTNC